MSSWVTGVSAITLFVDDLDAAKLFYDEVFAVQKVFEDGESAAFKLGGTIVNLLVTSAAHELVAPAAVGQPDLGTRAQMTIEVEDVDAVCAELAARGVELLNGPMDRPWGVRTASFRDPSGHVWEIAH